MDYGSGLFGRYAVSLNLNLQGELKMLPDLVQFMFAFVNQLKLFRAHIRKGNVSHFPLS